MINIVDTDGRALSVEPVVRPLIALKSGQARGSALDRALRSGGEPRPTAAALARLTDYDLRAVDADILRSGLASIERLHGPGGLLFVPVAYATLASPGPRRDALALLTEAQARLGARVALEISSLDPGLPPSRLIEILIEIRLHVGAVFARIRVDRRAVIAVTGCGFTGASLEAADLPDPEDEKALTRTRLALGAIGPRMLIHNLRTMAAINAARAAGITYASLDIAGLGAAMGA